jgi:hypothetical protein
MNIPAIEVGPEQWKVDVVDWATTGAALRKSIARDKVVVQSLEIDESK